MWTSQLIIGGSHPAAAVCLCVRCGSDVAARHAIPRLSRVAGVGGDGGLSDESVVGVRVGYDVD